MKQKLNQKISKKIKSVERPGNGSSSKGNKITKTVRLPSKQPPISGRQKQKFVLEKQKTNIQPEGFIDDAFKIGKVGLDVLTTGSKILNEPLDLDTYTKAIPDTIMKTVETVNELIDGVPKKKVVLSGQVKPEQSKLMDLVAKEAPVFNTTAMPTGFATDFVKPDTKITQLKSSINGMAVSRIENTAYISPITFPPVDVPGTASSDYRTSLFAFGNFGSRVDNFVKLFDRFAIRSLTYTYVPATGTDTKGSVIMMFRRAPKDFTSAGAIVISDASQLERYQQTVPYKGMSMPIPVEDEFLYTGDVTSTDPKWYSNGFFCIASFGNTNVVHPENVGDLYCSVVIDCYGAVPPNYFPSLLSGPALTRMLGMSIYQNVGNFTNTDLRNLFSWTNYVFNKVVDEFKSDSFLLSDEQIDKTLQCSLSTLSKRKLTTKNHKFRHTYEQFSDLDKVTNRNISTHLNRLVIRMSQTIDDIFKTKPKGGETIKSFIRELFNWNVLSSTYVPWMTTLKNYLPNNNSGCNLLVDPTINIWNFLTVILNDLESLFSVDKELHFDPEFDFDNFTIIEDDFDEGNFCYSKQ